MTQPDARLFGPIMTLRYAIIAVMAVAYTVAWAMVPEDQSFAIIALILAGEAILSAGVYLALNPWNNALMVHISLLIDTLATTGLVLCTGFSGTPFPLFYLLIVLAAGLLYGQATGIYYLACVSLANAAALVLDQVHPVFPQRSQPPAAPYVIMGAALPVVAFQLLLVVKLTQRGRYLQALYENVSDGLFILDDAGRIVDANSRASQMTGLARPELIGLTLESLVVDDGGWALPVAEQVRRCMAGEAVSFELAMRRRSGEPLPVEISAQHVTGLLPGRVQALARDISARRLMEAEIRRQNEQLRRINQELQVGRDLALNASRLKSQFLANMSHELRTPLNSIIGYTQFVLDDRQRPLQQDQQEDLRRVLSAGRHLLDLINGVLDLARIESGRESVSISRFPLRELVESVIDAVAPMAKSKALPLECRMEDDLPQFQTDENKLRQVLLNLLANAVKFTERGFVRLECRRDGSDQVRIVVSDTGIGIPAAHLDEIFNEFHQVGPAIHKQYGGTGLGLAIAKRLVELLKGTIHVESVVGSGSTFAVTLPITLASAHNAAGNTTVVPVRSDAAAAAPPEQAGSAESLAAIS
jgi:PAS domain S-box-containing protein